MRLSLLQAAKGLSTAACVAGAVSLAGCGGGGAASIKPDMMTGTMTPTTPALSVPTGMTVSSATPIYARSSNDTIATLLPDATQRFAPVSARSRSDGFHVKSIASDGSNGFVVTYVVAGTERRVHFEADDYATPEGQNQYYTQTEDGARFWLGYRYGSFTGEEKNQGSPYFEYMDVYDSGVNTSDTWNRQYLAFGTRTPAANLPAGSATYAGTLNAENHAAEYRNLDDRSWMWGNWRLTADFSQSTLQGEVGLVRVLGPGESRYGYLPHTTSFRIENGQIVDGQLSASISGVDSAATAAPGQTLRGFEGNLLGEFYGPGAEEAGGVMRATRTSDNRVLVGSFAGKRAPELDPSIPAGDLSMSSVAVHRDFVDETVRGTTDAEVTGIESDGATGLYVTYTIDGVDARVHLQDFHHYSSSGFWLAEQGTEEIHFLKDETGGLTGTPEFDYFNVHRWVVLALSNDENYVDSNTRGFVVYGPATEAGDLPTGSATYEGRARMQAWLPDNPSTGAAADATGRLILNADFDASTVDGAIDQITGPQGILSEVTIENGQIRSSELSATLRGAATDTTFDGTMRGRFFGPQAAEVAGVLDGTYTQASQTRVVEGWFGGSKQ